MVQRLNELDDAAGRRLTRRAVLAGFLSAYTASLIPWALAQPAMDEGHAAFLALSAIIAGRQALNPALAQRLYDALVADDPGFPGTVRALLARIEREKLDAATLQQTLDGEGAPAAALPRRIATAWFLGIVGEGAKARCLAYESALNAVIVADVLKPPTYAYGPYGSWARKPA